MRRAHRTEPCYLGYEFELPNAADPGFWEALYSAIAKRYNVFSPLALQLLNSLIVEPFSNAPSLPATINNGN
jgi:hypothetical protein